jgi:hypothetical protein
MGVEIWIGSRKGLFIARRKNNAWVIEDTAFLGVPVTMLLQDPRSGLAYAALDHGHFGVKLQRSENRGKDWQEIAAPAYPPKPEGVSDLDPMRNQEIPWDTKLIWSLEAGPPARAGELWCGTMPGGLFRSRDHGDSWEINEALWHNPLRKEWFGGGADLPGIHSILLHPDDPGRITLGISCGGVWVSEDAGASWDCRADGMRAAYMPPEFAGNPNTQDPHRLAQCPAAPEVIWCQHHNGVFLSEDRSASWRELDPIEPSSFGFAVAVHPDDPDTAWRVPAAKDEERIPVDGKVVVSRTRDRGQSWQVLDRGLPGEHAYDLVFRHGLDVCAGAEVLAMGSTSGSAWVSEDQGDSWATISTHLPPIYCLRLIEND